MTKAYCGLELAMCIVQFHVMMSVQTYHPFEIAHDAVEADAET